MSASYNFTLATSSDYRKPCGDCGQGDCAYCSNYHLLPPGIAKEL